MVTLTLQPDGTVVASTPDSPRLPRRVQLSRAAVERLAELTGTPLPWNRLHEPTATERALGPPSSTPPIHCDPEPELRGLGLRNARGDLFPELPGAMAVFGRPEVLVDVDVSVRRSSARGASAQVHSWHRLRDDQITTISTAGGSMELGWFAADQWQGELARAVTLDPPASPAGSPAPVLCLPLELLLGSGEAIRLGRHDVFAELLSRHGSDVRVGDEAAELAQIAEQVWLLHTSALGRMRTVVSGTGVASSRTIGWISWSLFSDGWRALTPDTRDGVALVHLHPVEPLRLGVEVARLVTGIRR